MLRSAFAAVLLAQGFAFPPVPTHFLTDNTGVLDLSTRAVCRKRFARLRTRDGESSHRLDR